MHRRVLRAVGLAAALALLTTGAALAGGQGADTVTQQARNVQLFSISTVNPCTGASGTFTATAATEIFHETVLTPGVQGLVTVTAQGAATFTPDDPQGVSASGHFAVWFGESRNSKNDVQHDTNTFQLNGTDGSHAVVRMADHLSINANGVVTVSFNKIGAHCG